MKNEPLLVGQANLQLSLWNAEAENTLEDDIMAKLLALGVPPEVVTRLREFWNYTKRVGEKLVSIGKIVTLKIIEFIEAHPHLAIGAALGAAVGVFIHQVPILGQVLAPLATCIGAFVGATIGHGLDKNAKGTERLPASIGALINDAAEVAMLFFRLLITVLNAVLLKA